jgi:hypothetical protein
MLSQDEYNAKRQARYERLVKAAEKAQREAETLYTSAKQMADIIPFGQPILVGHYSENRDRRYRERIDNKRRKGYALYKAAEQLRERAASMKDNTTIFSDDPSAPEKLQDKLERLEARQARMKAANKLVKKGDRAGLAELGYSPLMIEKLFTPDFCGRVGYPDYEIANNGANIKRVKDRIKVLDIRSHDETSEKEANGIRVIDNVEDNRVQIYFPTKPAASAIAELKSHGFRWTPTLGCWQAYRNPNARQFAWKLV